ncbi:MAG: AAA family ATPase [Candidatus Marinimicrobia bacterium]|nr:AAA family ATPase [Candidatus Neomarinimicrobiota bacterium]
MQLRFKSPHKSIKNFNPHEVGEFTIITGVNGSGKTHLLEALASGNLTVDGIKHQKLKYYSSTSFQASIEESSTPAQAYKEREGAITDFLRSKDQQLSQLRSQLNSWGFEGALKVDQLFQLTDEELESRLLKIPLPARKNQTAVIYKDQIKRKLIEIDQRLANSVSGSIYLADYAAKENQCHIATLTEADLKKVPIGIVSDNAIQLRLASQFSAWLGAYEYNRINRFYAKEEGKDLEYVEDEEFFKNYGAEPWVAANDILEMGNLPYRFNKPEGTIYDLQGAYQLRLVDQQNGEKVTIGDLSSGEKNLLALIALRYQSQAHNGIKALPKVLLLDEIDAHLHPSFTDIVLQTLKTYFVDQGISVILATHSPSTVALGETNGAEIYELKRSDKTLKRITTSQASSILTSGFLAVLPDDRIIITEANDDADYYQKVHDRLVSKGIVAAVPSLRFIPASSTSDSGTGGGCSQTTQWAEKLSDLGLSKFKGLVDWDPQSNNNQETKCVKVIKRSALENYLYDPLTLLALMIDNGGSPLLSSWSGSDDNASCLLGMTAEELTKLISDLEVSLGIDQSNEITADYHKHKGVRMSSEWVMKRGHDLETFILGAFNNTPPFKNAFTSNIASKGGGKSIDYQTSKYVELLPSCLIETVISLKA